MAEAKNRSATPRDLVPAFADLVQKTRLSQVPTWSQRQLALAAKVSPMCISEIESRKRSPSLRVAAQVARALSLDIKLCDLVNDAESHDAVRKILNRKTIVRPSRKPYFRTKKPAPQQ